MWAVFELSPSLCKRTLPLPSLHSRFDATFGHLDLRPRGRLHVSRVSLWTVLSSRPTLATLSFCTVQLSEIRLGLYVSIVPRVLDKAPLCIITKKHRRNNLSEVFILCCLICTSPGWKEESLFLVFSCVSPASPYDHHYVTKSKENDYSIVNSTVLSFSVIKYKYPGGKDTCTDCVLLPGSSHACSDLMHVAGCGRWNFFFFFKCGCMCHHYQL